MEYSARFWNRIARKYAAKPIEHEADYQHKLDKTRGYFNADMKVLEFACGTGGTAMLHAPYVKQYHAIDISEKMIELAEEKADHMELPGLSFEVNTIEAIPLEDASLDMVLGLSILHLLEDKAFVIKKIFTALKPGGLFVSSTTCLADAYGYLKYIGPVGRLFGFMPPLDLFTAEELRRVIIESGFVLEYDWLPAKGRANFIIARKLVG